MSIQKGQPGKSTRDMEFTRYLKRMGLAVLVLLLLWLFLHVLSGTTKALKGVGVGVTVVVLVGLLSAFKFTMKGLEKKGDKIIRQERQAGRGAQAEEKMGDIFAGIPDCIVLHDVPCDYGNIDHVLLHREKGLFVIETKSHGGKVTMGETGLLVNGSPPEKDFIAQTSRNCMWLKKWVKENCGIEPWVSGVIVFTNAFVEVRGQIRTISVINAKFLGRFLERAGRNRRAGELWAKRERMEGMEGLK